MDYSNWTIDQLQARFVESGSEYTRLANERHELDVEIQARMKRAAIKTRIGTLSEAEKEALREVLGPKAEPKVIEEPIMHVQV
jgi:hypothetical protein